MKKIICFFITFIIISCSVSEKPVFIKVDEIKILSSTLDTLKISAYAYFKNPNDVGGKLKVEDIRVLVNEVEVAKVETEKFDVLAQKEFKIPLQVEIPASKILGNEKKNFLGNLISSILKKKVKVQFKGDLKYEIFMYSDTYFVDETQEIKIKY